MRFLHTADWHVGKMIGGRSRSEEHRAVLAEILDIGRREKIDCLLVSGDVFESAVPGAEAEKTVYDFFRDLGRAAIPAVVISGNHDHERRLAAVSSLLEIVRVTVRHDVRRPEENGITVIESRRGERAAIAAIPFIPEHRMIQAETLMREEAAPYQEYAEGMRVILGDFAAALERHPIRILMAHLHVDKSALGGGERELHIGQTYAVPPASLPPGLHYLALGHIHRPQAVAAPSPARFAGSPLALDFGETRQEKSVVLVEIKGTNAPAHIETIALTAGRALRDVRGTLDELATMAADCGDDYLRVFVRAEVPVPGLADQVRKLLPNAVQVQLDTGQADDHGGDRRLARLAPGLDPADLYTGYYQRKRKADPPPELIALFRELMTEAMSERES